MCMSCCRRSDITRDAVSPVGDLLASPNFEICDTAHIKNATIIEMLLATIKIKNGEYT